MSGAHNSKKCKKDMMWKEESKNLTERKVGSKVARLNLGCFFIEEILKIYITTNSANLKVTIIAGVKFKNIRNTVAHTSAKNKVNLTLQSTRQMPLFTSPGN